MATVEAILEGATRILERDGFGPRFTAARIAEEAGVGVGSLYEYFTSKDAIVAALGERHLQRVRELVDGGFATYGALPLPEAVGGFVEALFELHELRAALHEPIHAQLARQEGPTPFLDTDHYIEERLVEWLLEREPEREPGTTRARAFCAVRAGHAVTIQAFAEGLDEGDRREVRRELEALLVRLLE